MSVFPARVVRLGLLDLHTLVEVLLSNAPVPARLHALRVLEPVIHNILQDEEIREKLPSPRQLYEYARLKGVKLDPPPSFEADNPWREPYGEWSEEDVKWFFRNLEKSPEEDVWGYLKRVSVLVSRLFAHLRILSGGGVV